MQRGHSSPNMRCSFNETVLSRVLPPLLVTEFVLGVLGNSLALWIFCFHLRPWKSSTVLLFNLAVADFLLILALPLRASYYISGREWRFGEALCNACLFMLAMNRSGSAFFLMAIAVDRYMRVAHPHHHINSLSVSRATCGALCLWLVTVAMTAHIFTFGHGDTPYCESFTVETETHSYLSWHKLEFLISFFLPLLVILFCTVQIIRQLKGRQLAQHAKIKKALYFIAAVVVLFIVCFLPSNITQLLIWIQTQRAVRRLPESQVCPALEGLTVAFYFTVSLTYLNSVLDPLVYYFSSPAFKNICRRAVQLPQADAESAEKRRRETGSHSLSQL